MNEPAPKPTADNREQRLTAALQRVEFWRTWHLETDEPEPKAYYRARWRHWEHTAKAISMEQPS